MAIASAALGRWSSAPQTLESLAEERPSPGFMAQTKQTALDMSASHCIAREPGRIPLGTPPILQ